MVSVDAVKDYLCIPAEDTAPDALLAEIIQNGYDYLVDAVDDFQKLYDSDRIFASKSDAFVKFHWAPAQYDEREGMHSDHPALNYGARSLLTQLQLYVYEEKEGENA